jgi:hypothetical protein
VLKTLEAITPEDEVVELRRGFRERKQVDFNIV